MRRIVNRMKAGKFLRLLILASVALCAATLSLAQADAAQVAVTVEKFTEDGEFIVEPLLIPLPWNQTAEKVTVDLLLSKSINFDSNDTGESFYLVAIYDPLNGKYLGMSKKNTMAGWMITVNNVFIGTSAGAHTLYDGDVIRWQYTKELGNDIGGNPDALGVSKKADNDSLVWKVA